MYGTRCIDTTISSDGVTHTSGSACPAKLLPERFDATSVPDPNGIVDFGPESSTPELPFAVITESYTRESQALT